MRAELENSLNALHNASPATRGVHEQRMSDMMGQAIDNYAQSVAESHGVDPAAMHDVSQSLGAQR